MKFKVITRGSALVALMLVTVIILGSMLMLHTAAVITIGGTSRALEIARQNAATALRLERATYEAAQSVYGMSVAPPERDFQSELNLVLGAAPLGAAEVTSIHVSGFPIVPRMFPDLAGPAAPLTECSRELSLLSNPQLMAYTGTRAAESPSFQVHYTFARKAVASLQTYSLGVTCRFVCVPLSRFGMMPYDLPDEIGQTPAPGAISQGVTTGGIGPRGLVRSRDPADIPTLATGSKRPGHFRYAAALSETYQYVFSKTYLQNLTDYVGATHFVQIGAGKANPVLSGGSEVAKTYTLDVGLFGEGRLGPAVETKDAAVFYVTAAGCSLILNDSGGNASPMLLVIAGPADPAAGPILVQLGSAIQRPVVLVCYHGQLDAPPNLTVNGALLLDRDCTVSSSVAPLVVGHVSYWGGSAISPDLFRLRTMPQSAENLVPRVLYVAVSRGFL